MSDSFSKNHQEPQSPGDQPEPSASGQTPSSSFPTNTPLSSVTVETDQTRQFDVILPASNIEPPIEGAQLIESDGDGAPLAAPFEMDEDAIQPIDVIDLLEIEDEAPSIEKNEETSPSSVDDLSDEEIQFYYLEGETLASGQAERAALMYSEAALVALRQDKDHQTILSDLEKALELLPNSSWLLACSRRIALFCRHYEKAIKLGQREVKLGGDNAERAAVLLEAASVVRYQAQQPQISLQLLDHSLQLDAAYVPALVMKTALCIQLEKYEEASSTLERLGECLTVPAQRSFCFFSAATIRELNLQDLEGAKATYLRAVEAEPLNIPATFALCEAYRVSEQWPLLARTLERMADLVEDLTFQSNLLLEAGSLHLEHTGDVSAASRDLGRAFRITPDNTTVLHLLAFTYQIEGKCRETIETLRQLLKYTDNKLGRAGLLTQIGLMHSNLHEYDKAQTAYLQALEHIPGYLPAIQEIGTLCRKRGDYEGLVTITRSESESLLPQEGRAIRYLEMGEILDKHLLRPEEAIEAYKRAIELSPTLHLAYWQLAALFRRLGHYDQLSDLLQKHADISSDPRTRAHLQLERSRILSSHLDNFTQAIDLLREMDIDSPPASIFFELAYLYTNQGRYSDLVNLLLEGGEATTDSKESECRYIWAAMILEQNLEEQERALAIYKQVLEKNPKSYAAIHGIGRILHRQGSWEELVKLYHHELTSDPDRSDAAILLSRMGRIIDIHLGNRSAAISAYAKALKTDPGYIPAIIALEELARREGAWPQLVKVLIQYEQSGDDTTAGVSALCRAADAVCWHLGDIDQAVELFERALTRIPQFTEALSGLLKVRIKQKNWSAAADLLKRLIEIVPSEEQRSLLQLKLARIKEFHLNEAPDLDLYSKAMNPQIGAQIREEVIRIKRQLNVPDLAESLISLGNDTTDDTLAASYFLESTYLYEFERQQDTGFLDVIRQSHDKKTGDQAIGWTYERALLREKQWEELARLTEKQAHLELERTLRLQRLASTGHAYFRAGLAQEAERVCRECLNFDVHCLPALRLLANIAEQRGDKKQLAEFYDRLAEASHNPNNRLHYCKKAAEIWSAAIGDTSRALSSLAVTLADDPNQPDISVWAESLLRKRGDLEELSRFFQRRIRASKDQSVLVDLLWKHAKLLRSDLNRTDRAISELNELLRITPNNDQALSFIANLHEEQGHWSDAASTLELLLERTEDAVIKQDARLRLASIWSERLHDLKRAKFLLADAANAAPKDLEVMRLQVNLATTTGDWDEAQRILEEMQQVTDERGKIMVLLKLRAVAEQGFFDAKKAEKHLLEIFSLITKDEVLLNELRHHLPSVKEMQNFCSNAEKMLANLSGEEAEKIRSVLVRIAIEDLRDPEHAMALLESAPNGDMNSTRIAFLRAEIYESTGKNAEALTHYFSILEEERQNIEAYKGLARTAPEPIASSVSSLMKLFGANLDAKAEQRLNALDLTAFPKGVFPSTFFMIDSELNHFDAVLQLIAPAIADIFPRPQEDGVSGPTLLAVQKLARSLGMRNAEADISNLPYAMTAIGDPIVVRINAKLAANPSHPLFRMWVTRALVLGIGGGAVLEHIDTETRITLIDALSSKQPDTKPGQVLRKKILSHLPRKERKQFDSMEPIDPHVLPRFRKIREQQADKIAIVLSRIPGEAIRALAQLAEVPVDGIFKSSRFDELIRFAISEDYTSLYLRAWGE